MGACLKNEVHCESRKKGEASLLRAGGRSAASRKTQEGRTPCMSALDVSHIREGSAPAQQSLARRQPARQQRPPPQALYGCPEG